MLLNDLNFVIFNKILIRFIVNTEISSILVFGIKKLKNII